MKTTLTRNQKKTFGPRAIPTFHKLALIKAYVRHDDQCGNGHNTFSITGEIYIPGRKDIEAGGCLHDEIGRLFSELKPLLKWHLCSTDGPMHYVQNSLYWAGRTEWEKPNLERFRSVAIWPEATEGDMASETLEETLTARLPALMVEFRTAVESLGFTY